MFLSGLGFRVRVQGRRGSIFRFVEGAEIGGGGGGTSQTINLAEDLTNQCPEAQWKRQGQVFKLHCAMPETETLNPKP